MTTEDNAPAGPDAGLLAETVEASPTPRSRPGLAIMCTIVVGVAYLVAQALVFFGFMASDMRADPNFDMLEWSYEHQFNGTVLAVATLAGAVAGVPLTLAFGRFVGGGSVRNGLALRPTSLLNVVGWTLVVVVYCLAADLLSGHQEGELVPEFMSEAYRTASPPALLWLALVVAAPLSEELLFRGLLFGGLVNTRIGFWGAAIITAASWAALHVQYEIVGIAIVALGGLIFATARHRTRSIYPCLAMHAAWNTIAMFETAYFA